MADNVQLNEPTTLGKIIASDEVSGVQYQIIKIAIGLDGVATLIDSGNPLPIGGAVSVSNFPATQPVSIAGSVPVTGTFFQTTQPVSGTVTANTGLSQPLTDAQLRLSPIDVKEKSSSTGGTSSVNVGASATVLALNANRLGATIYNESGGACRIKLGASASATDYTMIIAIGGYYEIPFGYTGIITGIAVSGTAVLRVTELT